MFIDRNSPRFIRSNGLKDSWAAEHVFGMTQYTFRPKRRYELVFLVVTVLRAFVLCSGMHLCMWFGRTVVDSLIYRENCGWSVKQTNIEVSSYLSAPSITNFFHFVCFNRNSFDGKGLEFDWIGYIVLPTRQDQGRRIAAGVGNNISQRDNPIS